MDSTQTLEGYKKLRQDQAQLSVRLIATAPGSVFLDPQVRTSFLPGDNECHRGLFCKADAMYFCFFALTGQAEQRNAEEGYGNEEI
jgi:hypothetical protein